MTILLTGTRAPATLDLARRLMSEGNRVIGVDSMRYPLGVFSNAYSAHYRLPSPRFERKAFVEGLIRLISKEEVTLLWPTCEETFHIAAKHEELSDHVRVFCDPLVQLEPLHHKLMFARLVGSDAPGSWAPEEAPTDRELVWKPCYSRFGARTRIANRPRSTTGWMAQEFLDGEEFSSWALCVNGDVRMLTFYDCPARAGRGSGCAFKPLWDDSAAAFVERFAEARRFTGSLSFDYIRGRDGRYRVIECNPRLTSGLHVLDRSVSLTDLLNHRGVIPPPMFSAQLKLPTFFSNPLVVGTSPDVISNDKDRGPSRGQFATFLELSWLAARHFQSLKAASTRDIEYNGK